VTDRPRLVGWSSLDQCTSPISDAPRRRRGHRLPVPIHRREACSTLTLRCAPRVDPRGLDRHRAAPCGTTRATIGTPSIVFSTGRVAPATEAASAFVFECATHLRAPLSPRCRRLVRQHVVRSTPGPAPRRRFALRLLVRRDARCVGPTSAFSRLRTSTRASPVSGVVKRFRACASETSPASRQCDSLRWAARSPWIPSRRACCSRRDACEPNL
jgi:hypothetical protein